MKKIVAGIVLIGILAIGWWLVSPLFLDKEVNEDAPMSGEESMNEENMMDGEEEKGEMDDMSSSEMDEDENMNEEMMMMYTGSFEDADEKHKASGKVKTIEGEDGLYVRFEEFEVTNGPDLYVYLTVEGQETKEGIELGKLKGNKGSQNYMIPDGTDLAQYNKVVIWCKAFDEDFGYANLTSQ